MTYMASGNPNPQLTDTLGQGQPRALTSREPTPARRGSRERPFPS
jgi:hypothetical protein